MGLIFIIIIIKDSMLIDFYGGYLMKLKNV